MKKNSSLKSIVYQSMLDGIIRGEYLPNQIINEQELVEKFGYSKSPIREALISLCNEGILNNIPRYGYEVIRLTKDDVEQILQFRLVLESGYLRQYYQTITREQLDELRKIDDICSSSSTDMWTHWDLNKNFHLKLFSFSGNDYAYRQLEKSMDILKRAYAQFYWNKWDISSTPSDLRYHSKILKYIENNEIDEAISYLTLDLKDFGVI